MSRHLSICIFFVLLHAPLYGAPSLDQPHAAAKICRHEFVEECTAVCLLCHTPPAELAAGEMLPPDAEGDSPICGQCHEERLYDGTKGDFLLISRGGNHPSNVPYQEGNAAYATSPSGVKIFCNESRTVCTVQCSSCHDPHENVVDLLRVNNTGSRLCFSCHRK